MATYKGIQGYSVQTLTSDPSPTASVEGQLWYNSTSGTYKIAVGGAGAWASGGDLNSTMHASGAGTGTQTAALCIAGQGPNSISPRYSVIVEEYNGTGWTEITDIGSARYLTAGAGTTTASVIFGGDTGSGILDLTESWNGTSWTEVGALTTARKDLVGNGTATAAWAAGGQEPASSDKYEQWNGASWTESTAFNTSRTRMFALGTTTAGIIAGGREPPALYDITEQWNGSTWTEVNDLNTARYTGAGSGTSTAGLAMLGYVPGGSPADIAKTEKWNGTSWTEVADAATGRRELQGGNSPSGGSSSSIVFGGYGPDPAGYRDLTEEWNDPVYAIKTVTTS